MNKTDKELLTSIYQNCSTAISSIKDIEPSVKNEDLRAELREELANYESYLDKCVKIAEENEIELEDNTIFEKARLWTSIKMTTIMDNSTRHLAEMMLLGSVMGTLQCYKDLSDHSNADKDLLVLCGDLLKLEEKHFNFLKTFLQKIDK